MSRLAALDLGTNSTRFLCVDDGEENITPSTVAGRGMQITRLGQGVDENGNLAAEALDRVTETLRTFDQRLNDLGGSWCGGVATSACRRADSDSTARLFDRVETITGCRPEIIEGEREAELTFKGVRASLEVSSGSVVDIGGGSTEWINFNRDGLIKAESISIGVVTLNERCIRNDVYTEQSYERMNQEIDAHFNPPGSPVAPVVCVGGTGTTLAALELDLEEYDPEAVHGTDITLSALDDRLNRLLDRPFEELAKHPVIQPGREDVIAPGLKILESALKTTEQNRAIVSDFGILAGYLAERIRP